MAHENTKKGFLFWNKGTLQHTNINRSPTAYLRNPEEERARYSSDVDKEMYLIKMTDINNNPLGAISWFSVHPTSMNKSNRLVSSDNKGYAEIKFEMIMNKGNTIGKGPFVAAFPQGQHGDTSPNINGARCIDTGETCDLKSSTCRGKSNLCAASGPGKDMFESTKIIGESLLQKAQELFKSATQRITGSVQFIHQYVDMTNIEIPENNRRKAGKTCKPALGYSTAAGTTDGSGMSFFSQGTTSENPLWNFIRAFVKIPSRNQKTCQSPKPILVDTGEMLFPRVWQPAILATQVLKIGNFILLPVSGEFTTMAGRRLKDAVTKVVSNIQNRTDLHIVVQSISNTYSSYVTTYEEYQEQRFEGSSTLYGPYTLDAYIQQYQKLTNNLFLKMKVEKGPDPPYSINKLWRFKVDLKFDGAGFRKEFGQVLQDVQPEYNITDGRVKVSVTYVSGNPRNSIQKPHTFLAVERYNETGGHWNIIATDADWETKFYWKRTSILTGQSEATIVWDIPSYTLSGTYRIKHFGHYKNFLGKVYPYNGMSSQFKVSK